MLRLTTKLSRYPLDKDSRDILRTGQVRIADRMYELSEYAEFIVSVCLSRARVLLTLDRGKVIYPIALNRAVRYRAVMFLLRMRDRGNTSFTTSPPPPRS